MLAADLEYLFSFSDVARCVASFRKTWMDWMVVVVVWIDPDHHT